MFFLDLNQSKSSIFPQPFSRVSHLPYISDKFPRTWSLAQRNVEDIYTLSIPLPNHLGMTLCMCLTVPSKNFANAQINVFFNLSQSKSSTISTAHLTCVLLSCVYTFSKNLITGPVKCWRYLATPTPSYICVKSSGAVFLYVFDRTFQERCT